MEDDTLGGYFKVHGRPPAFEGSDGRPYSVGVVSDDDAGPEGRFGAALLFVRWTDEGKPEGHLESDYLAWGTSPEEAERQVNGMSLLNIKQELDSLIAARRGDS